MKKRFLSALLALTMVSTLFVGCSDKTSSKGESSTATDSSTADSSATESVELEKKVVVYSAHPEKMLDVIIEGFTKETGIEVECLNLGGDLAERVRTEKANPQADVIYGQDTATYMALKDEGCLAASTPSWANELGDYYKDADGYWYGTIKTPVLMFYNTDLMTAEEAPKDWKDLADEKYLDKIIVRGSAASSSCTLISCWLDNFSKLVNEEAGWDFISKFDKNVKYYDDVKTLIMQAVGKGEAAIGISTLNDIYDNITNNGLPLQEIYSESGDVVLADCAAVVNNCANPNAAAAFLEYVGSAKVQAQLANEFLRCPTLDSALAESPEWMSKEIKALDVDWTNIGANKSEWIKKWVNEYMNADIKSK